MISELIVIAAVEIITGFVTMFPYVNRDRNNRRRGKFVSLSPRAEPKSKGLGLRVWVRQEAPTHTRDDTREKYVKLNVRM